MLGFSAVAAIAAGRDVFDTACAEIRSDGVTAGASSLGAAVNPALDTCGGDPETVFWGSSQSGQAGRRVGLFGIAHSDQPLRVGEGSHGEPRRKSRVSSSNRIGSLDSIVRGAWRRL